MTQGVVAMPVTIPISAETVRHVTSGLRRRTATPERHRGGALETAPVETSGRVGVSLDRYDLKIVSLRSTSIATRVEVDAVRVLADLDASSGLGG